MKNTIAILIAVFAFAACKKTVSADPTSTTADISVTTNKSYKYSLGTLQPSDVVITTAASHGSASKVAFVTPDSTAFVFVPDTNYTGPDQVILTVQPEHHCDHQCNHQCCHGQHKGNCDKASGNGSAGQKYVLNFIVTQAN